MAKGGPSPAWNLARKCSLLRQLCQQRLCLIEVHRVEAFSEPTVNRSKQFVSLLPLPLVAPEPGEKGGGAQFPEARPLIARNVQGFAQMAFDFRCWNPLEVEHLGMKPMDLGAHVMLTVRLGVPMRGLDVTEHRHGPAGE